MCWAPSSQPAAPYPLRSDWGDPAAGEVAKGEEEDDRVHVFTVASGHMYERLQKIMILSVLRNTTCVLCATLTFQNP